MESQSLYVYLIDAIKLEPDSLGSLKIQWKSILTTEN